MDVLVELVVQAKIRAKAQQEGNEGEGEEKNRRPNRDAFQLTSPMKALGNGRATFNSAFAHMKDSLSSSLSALSNSPLDLGRGLPR